MVAPAVNEEVPREPVKAGLAQAEPADTDPVEAGRADEEQAEAEPRTGSLRRQS